jgi:hypothetical protein
VSHEQRVNEWIARGVGALPRLMDLSPKGRQAFLDKHQQVLWVAWTRLFELELVSRAEWIDVASACAAGRDEREGAEWITERILKAFRERPTLRDVPAWANILKWYAWWRGGRHSARGVEVSLEPRGGEDADGAAPRAPSASDGFHEALQIDQMDFSKRMRELLELVETWAGILARAVQSTGLASLEVDWLWATVVERRPIAQVLEGASVDPRFLEVKKRELTRLASVPGKTGPERLARSRRGVAACFRFNLEALVSEPHPGLAEAHRIFLGPVSDPDESPARPARPVTPEGLSQFRHALAEMERRTGLGSREEWVEKLWANVFKAALNREVTRLLPAAERDALRRDWSRWERG